MRGRLFEGGGGRESRNGLNVCVCVSVRLCVHKHVLKGEWFPSTRAYRYQA